MFFKQFTIMVRDLEKSIAFYKTFAGLSITPRFQDGPAELAFLANKAGETEIELVSSQGMQTFEGKGFFICFLTDKLDELRELALSKGFNASDIRIPDEKTRYFYVYDPDGVSVQLKQRL